MQIGLTIMLGYLSIAVAFGVSGRSLGFPLVALAALSVFVFAGASQFLAIQLLAAGAGGLSVVAATLVLNARHLAMAYALRDRIDHGRVPVPVLAFGITDEVFAAAATRPGRIRDTELLTMQALAYSGWVGGTVIGFAVGGVLPPAIEAAMGIALYALFVALLVPGVIRFPRYGVVALSAGAMNWILQRAGMGAGPSLLLAIVAAATAYASLPSWSERDA